MLTTPLCRQLGIAYPIFSVGRGALAGTRTLTDRPFGATIILARPADEQIAACLEVRVPLLVFFWGDPAPYVESAHRRGTKVFVQVGSVQEARAAANTVKTSLFDVGWPDAPHGGTAANRQGMAPRRSDDLAGRSGASRRSHSMRKRS